MIEPSPTALYKQIPHERGETMRASIRGKERANER